MTYEPKPEHRFSFGLWTVGNIGIDPFGEPVREVLSPVQLVELLAEVGAWGVNLHDNDLVPIDASAHERDQIVVGLPQGARRDRPRRADGDDEPVPRPGLPRRRLHRERPAGPRATRCRRRCARSTSASSSARRRTCSGAVARASRPTRRRTRCVALGWYADAMNFLCALREGPGLRPAVRARVQAERAARRHLPVHHRRDARVHRDARALGDGRREPRGRARAHGRA